MLGDFLSVLLISTDDFILPHKPFFLKKIGICSYFYLPVRWTILKILLYVLGEEKKDSQEGLELAIYWLMSTLSNDLDSKTQKPRCV